MEMEWGWRDRRARMMREKIGDDALGRWSLQPATAGFVLDWFVNHGFATAG